MNKAIWIPSKAYKKASNMNAYILFLKKEYDLYFADYQDLWSWSIHNLTDFWKTQLQFHQINYDGEYKNVLQHDSSVFIGNKWFEGISLNYAEHIFKEAQKDHIAVIYKNEINETQEITWGELYHKTSLLKEFLESKGVQLGDRVVGILNNTPDTLALFLAVNAIGAIWSCCSPDFGLDSVIERFLQIKPKLLFCETEYHYNGKKFDLSHRLDKIMDKIPFLEEKINLDSKLWNNIKKQNPKLLTFEKVAFDHPIWILFSSGTTGKPKAITQGTGGILLEHYKALSLHQNVQQGDRFLWYSTTGWMMWNYSISSLLCGATLVLYDGSLNYPDSQVIWKYCQETKVDHLGAGASFLSQKTYSEYTNYMPKTIGSTGSPLSPYSFIDLQKQFPKTQIISLSGGTDICSAFVSGTPLWPVHAGEIQCRTLGSDIVAYDDQGNPVDDAIGELIIRQVMPSMPLYFWGDVDNQKYKESYFEKFSGVWCHGDWIKITKHKGVVIYGRSDSTLNRDGVRIGTAEIYNALAYVKGIKDSLVLTLDQQKDESSKMFLYVQLKENTKFDEKIIESIKMTLRNKCSPRHVPDYIYDVPDIPYTLSGKKLEIPVKNILQGIPLEKAVSLEVVRNPSSFEYWLKLSRSV